MEEIYPVYFEVTLWIDERKVEEGGFIYASNYAEAATILEHWYSTDLLDMKIEILEDFALVFPLQKAKNFRKTIDTLGGE